MRAVKPSHQSDIWGTPTSNLDRPEKLSCSCCAVCTCGCLISVIWETMACPNTIQHEANRQILRPTKRPQQPPNMPTTKETMASTSTPRRTSKGLVVLTIDGIWGLERLVGGTGRAGSIRKCWCLHVVVACTCFAPSFAILGTCGNRLGGPAFRHYEVPESYVKHGVSY